MASELSYLSMALPPVLVAGLIGYLAWRDRDRTSPRFADSGYGEES